LENEKVELANQRLVNLPKAGEVEGVEEVEFTSRRLGG
jgi:hypothetical protein